MTPALVLIPSNPLRGAPAARPAGASHQRDAKVPCGNREHASGGRWAARSTFHSSRPEEHRSDGSTSSALASACASSSRTLTRASISAHARPRDHARGDEECTRPRARDVESTRAALDLAGALDGPRGQVRDSSSRRTSTSSVYRATLAASCSARRDSSAFTSNRRGTIAQRARPASLVVGEPLASPPLADGVVSSDAPEVDAAPDRLAAVNVARLRGKISRGPHGAFREGATTLLVTPGVVAVRSSSARRANRAEGARTLASVERHHTSAGVSSRSSAAPRTREARGALTRARSTGIERARVGRLPRGLARRARSACKQGPGRPHRRSNTGCPLARLDRRDAILERLHKKSSATHD
jgi:hypothetical protein